MLGLLQATTSQLVVISAAFWLVCALVLSSNWEGVRLLGLMAAIVGRGACFRPGVPHGAASLSVRPGAVAGGHGVGYSVEQLAAPEPGHGAAGQCAAADCRHHRWWLGGRRNGGCVGRPGLGGHPGAFWWGADHWRGPVGDRRRRLYRPARLVRQPRAAGRRRVVDVQLRSGAEGPGGSAGRTAGAGAVAAKI